MKQKITTITLMLAAFAGYLFTSAPHSTAISAGDWRADRIIDDVIFTDANSMSVADIQAFLNKLNPTCDTNGTKPAVEYGRPDITHAQYAALSGWPAPPYVCLKDYYEVPKSAPGDYIPANNFTGSIPAGAVSAAQMIYDAAQLNRINPKVILIKLATESAGPLTSDTWPLQSQYTYAMGSHCPDSGINNSANCDRQYAGFSLQVSSGVGLLRTYIDNMDQPWWPYKRIGSGIDRVKVDSNGKPLKDLCSDRTGWQSSNCVGYTTIDSCGGTVINIQTRATAALYTYTPYQPNQAALTDMYGQGDNCSSHGNRNFWVIWNRWFGSAMNSNPYAWQYVSQAAYLDSGYTQKIRYGDISVQPNQTLYLEIVAKNAGYKDWNPLTRIGTSRTNDRTSLFANQSWLVPQRPVALGSTPVLPGDTATFRFSVTAPSEPKSYREYFNIVQDGAAWMNDPGLYFNFNVTQTAPPRQGNKDSLSINGTLQAGQYLLSQDANTALYMMPNGNLVLFNNALPVWSSNTAGNNGSYAILQGDANFVLYSKDGRALWNSGTRLSTPGAALSLTVQSDANLVLYENTTSKWSTGTLTAQSQYSVVNTAVLQGGILLPGQRIETADRARVLILQGDGNLVLYNAKGVPLWNTGTAGRSVAYLTMQTDGNLVLYSTAGNPLWNSGTYGQGLSYLRIQDDSNLVIYRTDARPTWSSRTDGK